MKRASATQLKHAGFLVFEKLERKVNKIQKIVNFQTSDLWLPTFD